MSGIVGIVNLDGKPVSRELLLSLTESLSFRGPDGNNIWIKDSVGLGHALLKTNQEPSTASPLTLDGKTYLTAHARIDDRQTLTSKLAEHVSDLSCAADTNCDEHLILLAYKTWGKDCVSHLIGDFSFALWDAEKRLLFCARDQIGVGQFFYAFIDQTFVFSNTLNCVRRHPDVSSRINEVAIGDFLLFGLNHDPHTTIFENIKRLPRAHTLVVSDAGLKQNEYWIPATTPVRYKANEEYVESFRELLDVAVSDRLRSSEVSLSMSGGLDSSMIAAIAKQKRSSGSGELKAYCVLYESAFQDDERRYASEVADALGIHIDFLDAPKINLGKSSRTCGNAPEPFDVDPFYVVSDELILRLSTSSRVALTGWDGDTFMAETPRHLFHELWRVGSFGALCEQLLRYVYYQRRPPPVGIRTWWQNRKNQKEKSNYPLWINASFAKRANLKERWEHKTAVLHAHPTRPDAFRNLNSPVWSALFAGYDAGVTRLPLEVRHPLTDVRLVNFLLGVPVIPWLLGKYILRETMRGVLPESVRKRPKTPLSGDPGLQLRFSKKISEIDCFGPVPEVLDYIDRSAVPSLSAETDSSSLWVNARPFSLNQWFRNSYKIESTPG